MGVPVPATATLVVLALSVVGAASAAIVRPPSAPEVGAIRAEVERVRAVVPEAGRGAGRVVLLVTVRYGGSRAALRLAPDAARSVDIGRLHLTVEAGDRVERIEDENQLVRDATRPFRFTHEIVLGRAASARDVSAGRLRVTASATQVVRAGGRGLAAPLRTDREAKVVRIPETRSMLRLPAPRCEDAALRASYARTTRLAIVCMGEGVDVRLGGSPKRGRARLVSAAGSRAVVTYRPPPRFVGADRLVLRASAGRASTRASVRIAVQPFKLRALGDSATAGFGYLGDGTAWDVLSLPECIPPSTPNDRCSSNSPNGVGSGNPVGWLPDWGLSNHVAWPAQFAVQAGLTGNGQYENWAVSGSTPTDWASGYLNSTLQEIVADMPDLVVMTLGANPLLDTFLFGGGLECAVSFSDEQLRACVQSFIDQVQLVPNLRSVLSQLLASPNTRVVVSQYHLAIPSLALFSVHQLELMFGVVNQNISEAATGTGFGPRLFLMTPPRFNVGRAPGSVVCPGKSFTVDGPSHQSYVTQGVLELNVFVSFCGSTDYWIISSDTGIHPTIAGHAQFAQALAAVVAQNNLVPPLPG